MMGAWIAAKQERIRLSSIKGNGSNGFVAKNTTLIIIQIKMKEKKVMMNVQLPSNEATMTASLCPKVSSASVSSCSIGYILFYSQRRSHFQVSQVLQFGSKLRPNLTNVFPVRRLGINNRPCLHHLLCSFRGGIPTYRKYH